MQSRSERQPPLARPGMYLCGIHLAKPGMCCHYEPWIWGETCFNKCTALKKIDTKAGGRCKILLPVFCREEILKSPSEIFTLLKTV